MKLLFSTDTDSGTVTVFDAGLGFDAPISTIPVGNGPRGAVRFTKDGRGFVSNHAGNTVSEIDALSLREVHRITVGVAPIGVAIVPGDRYALVSNGGDNAISIIDLSARKDVYQIAVGREPRHLDISPSGEYAYAPISGADYISKLDLRSLQTGQPQGVREVARIFLGKGTTPYSAAVSPDGKWVVAANNQETFISIIETSSDQVARTVDVGVKDSRGTAFTPDSTLAFVSIEDTSEIVVIDLTSGEIDNRLDTGPGPRGVLFDADTDTLFASAFSRTRPGAARAPNSVSIMNFGGQVLTTTTGLQPQIVDMRVGAGPCGVSMYRAP